MIVGVTTCCTDDAFGTEFEALERRNIFENESFITYDQTARLWYPSTLVRVQTAQSHQQSNSAVYLPVTGNL